MVIPGHQQNLGKILLDLERITESDIERALDYQREHGGFFGEALVAMGIVDRQSVGWCLASQASIPYIFPKVDEIDPDAAHAVTGSWARRHMALPITRADGLITLAVDSPLNREAADELARLTGCGVELALASTDSIRALIESLFPSPLQSVESQVEAPLSLDAFNARARGARCWGISVREERTTGWHDGRGTVERFGLDADWASTLNARMNPGPASRLPASGEIRWLATYQHSTGHDVVEVSGLVSPGGVELLVELRESVRRTEPGARPPGVLLEPLREMVRSGGTLTLGICTSSETRGADLLAGLPQWLLPPLYRSVVLGPDVVGKSSSGDATAPFFSLPLAESRKEFEHQARHLARFRLDAVSLDARSGVSWMDLRGVAPVLLVLMTRDSAIGAGGEIPAGMDWLLELSAAERKDEWKLLFQTEQKLNRGMG